VKLNGRRSRQRLDSFVEEWWELYAQPNLERSTLIVYRWAWERHTQPRLGGLRLRDVTPLTIARFRASLEASKVGAESVRKTLTMLQSVFQRAVEWQVLEANPVRAARKPPLGRARTVPAIGPSIIEAMRADLRSRADVSPTRCCSSSSRMPGCGPERRSASNGAMSANARSWSSGQSRTDT
jgi:site-specific recombinase XerD